jgi:hypothetical protein
MTSVRLACYHSNVGVELQGLVLIVHEDAHQFELHGLSYLLCVVRFWYGS